MSSTITSDRISHTYGYAWLGTAGKSASTATRDGVEVRRNLCTNPSFEVDVSGWSTSGLTTTSYAWTGTANASSSTQSTNGTVRRTNLALDPTFSDGQVPASSVFQNIGSGEFTPAIVAGIAPTTGGNAFQATATDYNGNGSCEVGAGMYTGTIQPGTYLASFWVAQNGPQVTARTYREGSAGTQSVPQTPFTLPTNTWVRVSYQIVVTTAGTIKPGVLLNVAPGVLVYYADFLIEQTTSTTPGTVFDGRTASTTAGVDVTRSTQASHSGLASMQLRWRNQSGPTMYATTQVNGLVTDTDYMASLWISIPRRLAKPITLSVVTNGYDILGPNPVTLQDATIGWQRIVLPFRTATNRTGVDIWLLDQNTYTDGNVSQSLYIDDVLVETGGSALPYFDGSSLGYVEFENTLPLLVNGWEEEADSLNVVNPVIGGGFDVTLRDASLRKGAFELVYPVDDEQAAAAAFAMHRRPTTFTISDSDRPSIAMTYVVNGRISRSLDQDRMYWLIRVEYQEVGS